MTPLSPYLSPLRVRREKMFSLFGYIGELFQTGLFPIEPESCRKNDQSNSRPEKVTASDLNIFVVREDIY